ncbi:MAG: putative rtx family calcium-binding cytotoxins and bacteriocins protein [Marmoricola sp.]|nr:putative rtx family calcium-binding cytotoxins and bacteriocins protein [Marmoricola sp.]
MPVKIINVTKYDQIMIGTRNTDGFLPGWGNDKVYGREGDDLFYDTKYNPPPASQKDDDLFVGGEGNDKFTTVEGRDVMRGGAGDDFVSGYNSDSFVFRGMAGEDTINIDTADAEDFNLVQISENHSRLVSIDGEQTINLFGVENITFQHMNADTDPAI